MGAILNLKNKEILYHTSNPFYREKINKEGLIPKQETWGVKNGSDFNRELGESKAIFLKKNEPYDTTYDDDIYEVDTSKINNIFHKDLYVENSVYTFTHIKREAIKLIHKGTVK